jgi:hypothetical protein
MGYLIEVDAGCLAAGMTFSAAIADLQFAYTHVETAFGNAAVTHLNGSTAALRCAFPRVQVSDQARGTRSVWAGGGNWELSEVHRQLCQVAVLIDALTLVAKQHPNGTVTGLSPTQQTGADATGADGNGGIWALEVFGGIDVRNNNKARNDAQSLLDSMGLAHRYFASFDDAWRGYAPSSVTFTLVTTSTGAAPVALRSV